MPERGGLSQASDRWLNQCLKKHPENLKTERELQAYYKARMYAVNYIATCRREAGILADLESIFTHKGHNFSQIDENLGTKQELESLAKAELEKIHWEDSSDDKSDEYGEDENDRGVPVEASESSSQRMFPEPISADEAESDGEGNAMRPEPVSDGEEEDDDEEAD